MIDDEVRSASVVLLNVRNIYQAIISFSFCSSSPFGSCSGDNRGVSCMVSHLLVGTGGGFEGLLLADLPPATTLAPRINDKLYYYKPVYKDVLKLFCAFIARIRKIWVEQRDTLFTFFIDRGM